MEQRADDGYRPGNFPRLKRTVALIGMMGSGKTAVGRALSAALRVPFLDSDHEIELAANASIAEIFARDGEPFFRAREAEVISRLLTGPPVILSTGGGAWLQPRNRETISAQGVAVWLKADLDLLWERVRHKSTRPLLRTDDPYATLAGLLKEREPIYELADITVEAEDGLSVTGMAEKVAQALGQHPDILEISHD